MTGRASARQYQRGFTLIEVMVAAVVLFLLAGVGIPTYRNYLQTGRQQAIMTKVTAFRMFEENYRIDNATYVAGTYVPNGANDFAANLGYRQPGDNSGITIKVEAGACGSIATCYRVIATSKDGDVGTYEGGNWTWN